MRLSRRNLVVLVFCLFLTPWINAATKNLLLTIKGSYLAYSYDFHQAYGENVEFEFLSYRVSCQYIRMDLTAQTFLAYGNVILERENEKLEGDEFLFSLKEKLGSLIKYGETVEVQSIGSEGKGPAALPQESLSEITLPRIQKSLISFSCRSLEISENFDVHGTDVTLYLEGLESVRFAKFKLSDGIKQRRGGVSLDRIWFTKSQGLVGRMSYLYEKEKRVNSLTQLHYEERSILKNYYGPARQLDLLTSTSYTLNENFRLGLTGNFNSSNLWNTQFWLNRNWSQKINTQLDFSYNKPINYKGEAWFGLQSTIDAEKLGNLSVTGRYEIQNQFLGGLFYSTTFLKNFSFFLNSSYSRLKMGGADTFSEIASGTIDLSYNSRTFNLATDYFLNYDLFGNQLLSQPQLRVGINPFYFYGGILSVGLTNITIYNHIRREGSHEQLYTNNTILNLMTQPMHLQKSLRLNFQIALEQFVERKGRNFTSGGFIMNLSQEFGTAVSVEAYYSLQSRRKTKGWLIEGTTSQDLSLLGRVQLSEMLSGWLSFSFDPKFGQWRQSFADLSVGIIKNWKVHSLLNYDFSLKKLNNIDLYLIREAGRFQLRFIWRSLSKQFLVELVPR